MPFGGLQPLHLLIILAVALIIFGPSRLPELGRSLGKSIREFRDAAASASDEVKKGLEEPSSTAKAMAPKPEVKSEANPEAKKESVADLPKS